MRRAASLRIGVATALVALLLYRAPKLEESWRQLVALWSDPARLPAFAEDRRVHFEAPARDCAARVAKLLPEAMARVVAVQLRPFAREPTVGVYASFENYARANGLGDASVAATARDGRVLLSPTLCGEERDRLPGVLTHELSHTHLFGWRGAARGGPLPSWFVEGLAVTVSNGGAAEQTSETEAAAALRQGEAIVVADDLLWRSFATIPFEKEPQTVAAGDTLSLRQGLAFREAAMFVAWLRSSDAKAFAGLLDALEKGQDFGVAFRAAYGAGAAAKWRQFRTAFSEN